MRDHHLGEVMLCNKSKYLTAASQLREIDSQFYIFIECSACVYFRVLENGLLALKIYLV